MKKILIFSRAMELGGAERALLGLLDNLDYSKYEVDLFLMRHEGELFPFINPNVNLLPEIKSYTVFDIPVKNAIKRGKILIALGRIFGRIKARNYQKKNGLTDKYSVAIEYNQKYIRKFLPKINPDVTYDLAISFLTPHYVVAEKVSAKKKAAWIHTDYSACQVDVKSETKMWGQYNKIVSISDSVTEAFATTFPAFRDRIELIENILPTRLIKSQMDEFNAKYEMPHVDDCVNLLSIGRFCTQKNFDNVPSICKRLIENGLNVKWYLIGFGLDEDLIKSKIVEEKMQDYVFILGKKENPYPYIAACDLYVQPSRFEGKAVTVREAQLLCKPVVITAFPTSSSQLEDGVDGVVVPLNNDECADGVAAVLKNQQLMTKLAENCSKRDYSNADEARKIDVLFI